jgi:hypothetical protein
LVGFLVPVVVCAASVCGAAETVDLEAVNRIRDEGLHRSQVMDLAWHLTETVGPRLTASPGMHEAAEWARETLAGWGLDARLESFDYGAGWAFSRSEVRMVAPDEVPLAAIPKAWTPGTDGRVRGRAVRADLSSEDDLETWRGKLAGAVVLLDAAAEIDTSQEMFQRHDDVRLAALEELEIPEERDRGRWRARRIEQWKFWPVLAAFLEEEGVVGLVDVSSRAHGVVRVWGGGGYGRPGRPDGVPHVTMTAEQYNRIVRLLDRGVDVELELDLETTFYRDAMTTSNVIAELPGTDLADEIVLVGAHLDSWHAGTGATDNGGNCAVVMEAVRILKDSGLRPRRTIRIALWTGEEQGLLGSREYVARHVASRPEPTDPEQLELPSGLREPTWPLTTLDEHGRISAYYNLDFGAGRIRGIFAQENVAAAAIFSAWIEAVRDLGATTVSPKSVGGTDHLSFDRVGVPAFQFIQDSMDYMTRTHHTHVDTYDHLVRDDLVQSATVLSTFLWHTANRDAMMPRKPMPRPDPDTADTD